MPFQRFADERWEFDPSPAALSLRLFKSDLTVDPLKRSPHREPPTRHVEIRPAQAQQLALAKTTAHGQDVQGFQVGSERCARWRRDEGKAPLQAEVESLGLKWGQEVLELGEVPAPEWVAAWFGIQPHIPVFVQRRRTWIEDAPTQLADSYYRLETVAGTAIREIDTGPGGGYARLEEKGYTLTRFREEIRLRMPSPDEARALWLGPGIPVAQLNRIAFTADGPVEVFESVAAGDKHIFCYEFPAPD